MEVRSVEVWTLGRLSRFYRKYIPGNFMYTAGIPVLRVNGLKLLRVRFGDETSLV